MSWPAIELGPKLTQINLQIDRISTQINRFFTVISFLEGELSQVATVAADVVSYQITLVKELSESPPTHRDFGGANKRLFIRLTAMQQSYRVCFHTLLASGKFQLKEGQEPKVVEEAFASELQKVVEKQLGNSPVHEESDLESTLAELEELYQDYRDHCQDFYQRNIQWVGRYPDSLGQLEESRSKHCMEREELLKSADKVSSIYLACQMGDLHFVQNYDGPLDQLNEEGFAPIHYAAYHDRLQVVAQIKEKGGSLLVRSANNYSSLHFAARAGNWHVAAFFLKETKELKDSVGSFNRSPLHMSVFNRRYITTNFLLKTKADPNLQAESGVTPLHYAVERLDEQMVVLLTLNNPSLNVWVRDDYGNSPVHYALIMHHTPILERLFSHPSFQKIEGAKELIPDIREMQKQDFFGGYTLLKNHEILLELRNNQRLYQQKLESQIAAERTRLENSFFPRNIEKRVGQFKALKSRELKEALNNDELLLNQKMREEIDRLKHCYRHLQKKMGEDFVEEEVVEKAKGKNMIAAYSIHPKTTVVFNGDPYILKRATADNSASALHALLANKIEGGKWTFIPSDSKPGEDLEKKAKQIYIDALHQAHAKHLYRGYLYDCLRQFYKHKKEYQESDFYSQKREADHQMHALYFKIIDSEFADDKLFGLLRKKNDWNNLSNEQVRERLKKDPIECAQVFDAIDRQLHKWAASLPFAEEFAKCRKQRSDVTLHGELQEEKFLFSENRFKAYLRATKSSCYYFNDQELKLAAHLFNKRVVLFREGEEKPQLFIPKNYQKTVILFSHQTYYSRLTPKPAGESHKHA